MRRISAVLFALVMCTLLALPALSTSAAPRLPRSAPALQQATDTPEPLICSDATLVKQVTDDVNSALNDLDQVAKTGAGGVFNIMLNLTVMRQKYEDMELPNDVACSYFIIDTITLISNVSDEALVEMADKLGFNSAGIAKARKFQQDRTQSWIDRVNSYIGK